MKELYINGKLAVAIYDIDLKVGSDEEDFEEDDISVYLQSVIQSNIDYDNVSYKNTIEWRTK